MSISDISSIRDEYSKNSLTEKDVNADPHVQFQKWFDEAIKAEVNTPNAMSLATVGQDGQPSVRIVLLKGLELNKFKFFTNYKSAKGKQIEENPKAALAFFWPELERQVRIEGNIQKLSNDESKTYFNSRPEGSKIGAWSSPQSSKIDDRSVLEVNQQKYASEFGDNEIPKPDHWGGYEIVANKIEFWQGRPSRLHDRVQYDLEGNQWVISRLAP